MITVELQKVRLYAYHGLFPEERKTGGEFEVSLSVSYQPAEEIISHINSTINYVSLFELVKEQFDTPVDLLETLVVNIAGEIKSMYPDIKRIRIAVSKLNPPVTGFSGNVAVRFEKEY